MVTSEELRVVLSSIAGVYMLWRMLRWVFSW